MERHSHYEPLGPVVQVVDVHDGDLLLQLDLVAAGLWDVSAYQVLHVRPGAV